MKVFILIMLTIIITGSIGVYLATDGIGLCVISITDKLNVNAITMFLILLVIVLNIRKR